MNNYINVDNDKKYIKRLEGLCNRELDRKFSQEQLIKASARLKKELAIIETNNIGLQFYLVAEMVNAARDKELVVTQRGTASGSIVAYASGITDINPLDYELSYESFLGPNGENKPRFEMNIADNATKVLMAQRVKEIYPEGEIYIVSESESYPNAIVIFTESEAGKIQSDRKAIFARAAADRRLELSAEDACILSEISPIVVRFSVNDSLYILQEIWHATGVKPPRERGEIERIFEECMSKRWLFTDTNKPAITMWYDSLVLAKIVEKMRVASVRELIDAQSISCVCGVWDEETIKVFAENIVPFKNSIWRICDRENVYEALLSIGIDSGTAFEFVNDLKKGRLGKEKYARKWQFVIDKVKESGAPIWYSELLYKTDYLFPRAHSTECVVTILQLLHYQHSNPELYYKFWLEKRREELMVYDKAIADKNYTKLLELYYNEVSIREYYMATKLKLS